MTDDLLDNYNPLYDIHLRKYFAMPHMQRHLRYFGLLEDLKQEESSSGTNIHPKHVEINRMLRNREAELQKYAELQRKLNAAEKIEICRRIRNGNASPSDWHGAKPSRSLSRGRYIKKRHHRRSSTSTDDKDLVKKIEKENEELTYENPSLVYNRLSTNIRKYRYLHKLDDETLSVYMHQLRRQLSRLERFREVSFGPYSVARNQTDPQISWFFRRRSLPSLIDTTPTSCIITTTTHSNTYEQPVLRSIHASKQHRSRSGKPQLSRNAELDNSHANERLTVKRQINISQNEKLPIIKQTGKSTPPKAHTVNVTKLPQAVKSNSTKIKNTIQKSTTDRETLQPVAKLKPKSNDIQNESELSVVGISATLHTTPKVIPKSKIQPIRRKNEEYKPSVNTEQNEKESLKVCPPENVDSLPETEANAEPVSSPLAINVDSNYQIDSSDQVRLDSGAMENQYYTISPPSSVEEIFDQESLNIGGETDSFIASSPVSERIEAIKMSANELDSNREDLQQTTESEVMALCQEKVLMEDVESELKTDNQLEGPSQNLTDNKNSQQLASLNNTEEPQDKFSSFEIKATMLAKAQEIGPTTYEAVVPDLIDEKQKSIGQYSSDDLTQQNASDTPIMTSTSKDPSAEAVTFVSDDGIFEVMSPQEKDAITETIKSANKNVSVEDLTLMSENANVEGASSLEENIAEEKVIVAEDSHQKENQSLASMRITETVSEEDLPIIVQKTQQQAQEIYSTEESKIDERRKSSQMLDNDSEDHLVHENQLCSKTKIEITVCNSEGEISEIDSAFHDHFDRSKNVVQDAQILYPLPLEAHDIEEGILESMASQVSASEQIQTPHTSFLDKPPESVLISSASSESSALKQDSVSGTIHYDDFCEDKKDMQRLTMVKTEAENENDEREYELKFSEASDRRKIVEDSILQESDGEENEVKEDVAPNIEVIDSVDIMTKDLKPEADSGIDNTVKAQFLPKNVVENFDKQLISADATSEITESLETVKDISKFHELEQLSSFIPLDEKKLINEGETDDIPYESNLSTSKAQHSNLDYDISESSSTLQSESHLPPSVALLEISTRDLDSILAHTQNKDEEAEILPGVNASEPSLFLAEVKEDSASIEISEVTDSIKENSALSQLVLEEEDSHQKIEISEAESESLQKREKSEFDEICNADETNLLKKPVMNFENVIIGNLTSDLEPIVYGIQMFESLISASNEQLSQESSDYQENEVSPSKISDVIIEKQDFQSFSDQVKDENDILNDRFKITERNQDLVASPITETSSDITIAKSYPQVESVEKKFGNVKLLARKETEIELQTKSEEKQASEADAVRYAYREDSEAKQQPKKICISEVTDFQNILEDTTISDLISNKSMNSESEVCDTKTHEDSRLYRTHEFDESNMQERREKVKSLPQAETDMKAMNEHMNEFLELYMDEMIQNVVQQVQEKIGNEFPNQESKSVWNERDSLQISSDAIESSDTDTDNLNHNLQSGSISVTPMQSFEQNSSPYNTDSELHFAVEVKSCRNSEQSESMQEMSNLSIASISSTIETNELAVKIPVVYGLTKDGETIITHILDSYQLSQQRSTDESIFKEDFLALTNKHTDESLIIDDNGNNQENIDENIAQISNDLNNKSTLEANESTKLLEDARTELNNNKQEETENCNSDEAEQNLLLKEGK